MRHNIVLIMGYGVVFLRSAIAFIVLLVLTRLLGKKQISQLTFFDYTTGITIGSIAASLAIDEHISFANGMIGLVVWTVLPIGSSYITLKNTRLKRILDGVPSILIQNGDIIYENLKKERYSVVDLLEELRLKDVFNVRDVEFAVLETSGKLSVLLKPQKQPLTSEDLGVTTSYQGLCVNLIIDGQVMREHLKLAGLSEEWLNSELQKRGVASAKDVVLAALETGGALYVDIKSKSIEEFKVLE